MEDEGDKKEREKLIEDQVAGCHVDENPQGGLTIIRGKTGDAIRLTRSELLDFVLFASKFIMSTNKDNAQHILLVGGPYHGEWKLIPGGVQVISFPTLDKAIYTNDTNPSRVVGFKDHIYIKANDVAFDGIRIPFEIFEHSSLREANVARNARLLDEELTTNKIKQDIQMEDVKFRNEDVKQALENLKEAEDEVQDSVNKCTESENLNKQIYEDGQSLIAKRRILQFRHGI